MKKAGLVIGGLITILGLSIMLTPLRTYFLVGWVIGIILLFNGILMFGSGFRKNRRSGSKMTVGLVTTLIGGTLLITDSLQMLTQNLIVYFVAGGILFSGMVECFVGYKRIKSGIPGLPTFILGIISTAVGIFAFLYQNTTVLVIGAIVGFHIAKIGLNIFLAAYNMDKPRILDVDGSFL